jgi:hypothetical protein
MGRVHQRSRRCDLLYKQSQSAPGRPEEAAAGRASKRCHRWDKRAKQSQFAQGDVKGKYFVEEELW